MAKVIQFPDRRPLPPEELPVFLKPKARVIEEHSELSMPSAYQHKPKLWIRKDQNASQKKS